MKKTLSIIAIATLSCFAHAQDSSSTSQSGSQSGSNSQAAATGNVNASQSNSASGSRADSGSVSGAVGNAITVNIPPALNGPNAGQQSVGADGLATTRSINQLEGRTETVLSGTTTANQNATGGYHNSDNINYSGTIDNKQSGGTYNVIDSRVSGSQTVRSAPAIAMSGPASGPCTGVSGGIAGSGIGWGFGVNMSAVMLDCRLRENTRVLGMGMQSLDGAANPQEKGEATVMLMDAMRALSEYNKTLYAAEKAK